MSDSTRHRGRNARRSVEIAAGRTRDAEFLALLRVKCLQAASIGALTAAGEAIPGLSSVLGLVFGELIDVRFLGRVQRDLIEQTFKIYGFDLPDEVRTALADKVQLLGTSASVASDVVVRQLIRRSLGGIGGLLARRVLPVASIVSSAFSNAWVTYALGKRAQALAQLQSTPLDRLPDALRAFGGVDERRVLDWTVEATTATFRRLGGMLSSLVGRRPQPQPARPASGPSRRAKRGRPRQR